MIWRVPTTKFKILLPHAQVCSILCCGRPNKFLEIENQFLIFLMEKKTWEKISKLRVKVEIKLPLLFFRVWRQMPVKKYFF